MIVLVGGAAAIAGCGQKGSLLLPTEAAARQRATLPQALRPAWARSRGADTGIPSAAQSPQAPDAPAIVTPPSPTDLVPESLQQQQL